MTGLFAFFYGTLHFLTYVIADRFAGLDFPDGMFTLAHGAQPGGVGRRGHLQAAVHHRRLHRVDDDAAAGDDVDGRHDPPARRPALEPAASPRLPHRRSLGVLHYWWLVKADIRRPLIYGVVVGALLAARWCARAGAPQRAVRWPERFSRASSIAATFSVREGCSRANIVEPFKTRHRRDGARAVGGEDPARAPPFAAAPRNASCRAARRHAGRRLARMCGRRRSGHLFHARRQRERDRDAGAELRSRGRFK